jgi:hypothetical protein
MKLMMILGGMIGFGFGITVGVTQNSSWPTVIWRASAVAYVTGVLFRWWGGVWIKGLRAALVERPLESSKTKPTLNSTPARS